MMSVTSGYKEVLSFLWKKYALLVQGASAFWGLSIVFVATTFAACAALCHPQTLRELPHARLKGVSGA